MGRFTRKTDLIFEDMFPQELTIIGSGCYYWNLLVITGEAWESAKIIEGETNDDVLPGRGEV